MHTHCTIHFTHFVSNSCQNIMGDDMDSAVKEAEEAIKEHCKEVNTELELLQPLLNQNSTQPQPNII